MPVRSSIRIAVRTTLVVALVAALAPSARAADLFDVYTMARQSDPTLKAAEAGRRASAEGVVQARSALLPQVTGTASLNDSTGRSQQLDSSPNPDGTVSFGQRSGSSDLRTRTYRVQLDQTIYNYANYTRLDSARSLSSKSDADYQAALDALFTRVAQAYFDALTAKTNLDASVAEEKAVGRQLEQANQRFEVGLSAITDVHEAQARFDASRASHILAQNQLDDAYEALTQLTGAPVTELSPMAVDIPLAAPEPADVEAWVKTAIDHSPTLASRQYSVDAARHDVKTAYAGHLPYLSASAGYSNQDVWGDRSSGTFTFPGTSSSEGNSFTVQLTVPIFSGFATQSKVHQAVANRDAADDNLEASRRDITRQTRSAYRSAVAGASEVEARKQALVSAQSALEATQAGFEVGTRTIVDVLLSEQNLYAAQREFARARHQFVLNGLKLKQAAGVIQVDDLQKVNALLK